MEESSVFEKFELQLETASKEFLKETAKWAYFLSIVGYVGIAFLLIFAVFAGTLFSTLGAALGPGVQGSTFGLVMGFIYFALGVIYFFPVYYLNKFASNAKRAFRENDSEVLTTSLQYLKSHYKFIGIFVLVLLALYGLMFVLAILGALLGR